MIGFQKRRLELLEGAEADDDGESAGNRERYRDLLTRVRAVQRATILHMRNLGEIDDEVMRRLERELDLVEARYSSGAL
jgi:monovalent cation/hydrogen antiporter